MSISKIDFGTKVVVNKNMGNFAYHLSLSATNCDDHPCMMEAEVSAFKTGHCEALDICGGGIL
jgi:hypothetical protein